MRVAVTLGSIHQSRSRLGSPCLFGNASWGENAFNDSCQFAGRCKGTRDDSAGLHRMWSNNWGRDDDRPTRLLRRKVVEPTPAPVYGPPVPPPNYMSPRMQRMMRFL